MTRGNEIVVLSACCARRIVLLQAAAARDDCILSIERRATYYDTERSGYRGRFYLFSITYFQLKKPQKECISMGQSDFSSGQRFTSFLYQNLSFFNESLNKQWKILWPSVPSNWYRSNTNHSGSGGDQPYQERNSAITSAGYTVSIARGRPARIGRRNVQTKVLFISIRLIFC